MSSNEQLVNTSMRARPRRARGGGAHLPEGGERARKEGGAQQGAAGEGLLRPGGQSGGESPASGYGVRGAARAAHPAS